MQAVPWKSGASAPRQALLEKLGFSPWRAELDNVGHNAYEPLSAYSACVRECVRECLRTISNPTSTALTSMTTLI